MRTKINKNPASRQLFPIFACFYQTFSSFLLLMRELLLLLKRFFGYTSFRPLQAEIIQRILQKEDSLVLMPTGGGKSICFQLPAIYLPGTAVVVSPLIALMKDQVEGLIANGIPAATLNSMMPEEERHRVRQLCIQGKVKLLYISPEGIMSELHWLLPRIDISLIAIDEAHCISHWGHDFRPEYTQLSVLKDNFPKVPLIALTATADKITRTDIINQLKLRDPQTFIFIVRPPEPLADHPPRTEQKRKDCSYRPFHKQAPQAERYHLLHEPQRDGIISGRTVRIQHPGGSLPRGA